MKLDYKKNIVAYTQNKTYGGSFYIEWNNETLEYCKNETRCIDWTYSGFEINVKNQKAIKEIEKTLIEKGYKRIYSFQPNFYKNEQYQNIY